MKITITDNDGYILGRYSTQEAYAQLKEEEELYYPSGGSGGYEPTEKEVFEKMMDDVDYDAEIFFKQRGNK